MTEPSVVTWELRGSVAVVWIDHPPLNTLSRAVRAGLVENVSALGAQEGLRGIVLAGRGRAWVAGADITEFDQPPAGPFLVDAIARVEASALPVVAAIHAHALGGGLELALGCHARIAGPKAQLGLPEVTLGILPGAGGTQRLPRLVGAGPALDLMLSARRVGASEAMRLGLVDGVVETPGEEAVVDAAIAWIEALPEAPALHRLSERSFDAGRAVEDARSLIAKKHHGEDAPAAIVDAVAAGAERSFSDALAVERELFQRLRVGPQSRALRHLFFAERQAAKVPGLTGEARDVGELGVVGGGTMGSGIAVAALTAGLPVTLLELDDGALEAARGRIETALRSSVDRGKLSPTAMEGALARLTLSTRYESFAAADLILEAVVEDLEVKRQVFAAVEEVAKPSAILASNTSYLDLDALAATTSRPADTVGLHFFSPANVMKLLEIVRGEATADDVLLAALALAKRLRKVPVVAGVCPGFIGNRLYRAYQREAGLLLLQGASPTRIDRALTDFGMKMGPIAVNDLAGLDIGYMARRAAAPGTIHPDAFRVHDLLVDAGDKGRKTGAGFYVYEGGRLSGENPKVRAMMHAAAEAAGITPRDVDNDEIIHRCLWALVDEGARAVDDGIAQRASDIDVVFVHGYGFPRYRGGPMHHAEATGLAEVVDQVRGFGWDPAPGLLAAADRGGWER